MDLLLNNNQKQNLKKWKKNAIQNAFGFLKEKYFMIDDLLDIIFEYLLITGIQFGTMEITKYSRNPIFRIFSSQYINGAFLYDTVFRNILLINNVVHIIDTASNELNCKYFYEYMKIQMYFYYDINELIVDNKNAILLNNFFKCNIWKLGYI